MTQLQQRFGIVVAVDDSEYAEIVLEHAFDQAARHDAVDLHAIAVVGHQVDLEPTMTRLAAQLRETRDAFGGANRSWRIRAHVEHGRPAEEIVRFAGEARANLLVIGRYGVHSWRGSVADDVVRDAPCPTLVVGLGGRDIAENVQCPDCVTARAGSDGERWFCGAHVAPDRIRLSALVPPVTNASQGLW